MLASTWLLVLLLAAPCGSATANLPTCQPGDAGCVPPSPTTVDVVGISPIEVSVDGFWKKLWNGLLGREVTYYVGLEASGVEPGFYEYPACTFDEHGLATYCYENAPSPPPPPPVVSGDNGIQVRDVSSDYIVEMAPVGAMNVTCQYGGPSYYDSNGRLINCTNGTQPIASLYSIDNNVLPVCSGSDCGLELNQNVSVGCWLSVGNPNPINQNCGDLTATRMSIGNVQIPLATGATPNTLAFGDMSNEIWSYSSASLPGTRAAKQVVVVVDPVASTTYHTLALNTILLLQPLNPSSTIQGGGATTSVVSINTGCTVATALNALSGEIFVTNNSAVVLSGGVQGLFLIGLSVGSGSTGSATSVYGALVHSIESSSSNFAVANVYGVYIDPPFVTSGTTMTTVYGLFVAETTLSGTSTTNNYGIYVQSPAGGTNNFAVLVASNTAGAAGGYCAGTVGDVCIFRAASNVWTMNSNNALWIPNYGCVGCNSAPTKTSTGAFTATTLWQGTTPNQVVDTLTCIGAICTKTNNAYVITVNGMPVSTPASSSAACTAGQMSFDSAFIYTCVATNTWRRIATLSF
jgi:hypothetical protein